MSNARTPADIGTPRTDGCSIPIAITLVLLGSFSDAAATGSSSTAPIPPEPSAGTLCLPAIAAAERAASLPPYLLRSIAFVESGRPDPLTGRVVPWPWTINAGGRGYYYGTKQEAVAAVAALRMAGVQSIDVGCAQVNLMHHPQAFASVDAAFDPATNAAYASRFLRALYATTGNWHHAAASYHSHGTERGYDYARRVVAIWPDASRYGSLPAAPADAPGAMAEISQLTPAFAAAVRRMEADRRARAPLRIEAANDRSFWINRPPEPRLPGPAGRRTAGATTFRAG
ncbi:lytic transglycosylase domain-containing protein [Roseomonas sp. CCTCC AB2023176]|uniref:lytic transglycosylase domain-containing protein n=1 Tax=Roseomonas sp. CCTCC AB2023176 TaxID=3342640 RepID=UPI0035E30A87